MIELQKISYTYPGGGKALDEVSTSFDRSEITVITGPNGCGKTTLTRLMVGILRPDDGRILIDGEDICELDLFEIGQKIGYVFQDPSRQLFCETVEKEIAYGMQNMELEDQRVKQVTEEYLTRFHIEHLRNRYPGLLSQGEKQRTALAAVLSMGSQYVVLDEPTTGLDQRSRRELGMMMQEIRDDGRGVIIVSHEKEFAQRWCDREWGMS